MIAARTAIASQPRRVDLHCHSHASTETDEAVLIALGCPECFSAPEQVYAQAKRRGMDFVALTDHDTLDGVLTMAGRPDVIVGEELTCYFPEDRCKMHVLVWGITPADHAYLQSVADDIYAVADYVAERRIAHSVAHPVYRQNDVLERWHLERLILMFKGFETLNGAHSILHREAFEPMLDELTPQKIERYAHVHGMRLLWPETHVKARTGGSDDHGLFNIGRTWTEFPPHADTVAKVLECLRTGDCRPGGEAGSSLKLAHNFFGVGIRYWGRRMRPTNAKPTVAGTVLETLVGDRRTPLRKRVMIKMVVKGKARAVARRIARPFGPAAPEPRGTSMLIDLFFRSFKDRAAKQGGLLSALRAGDAPLGEHEAMFDLVSGLNRDIAAGIFDSVRKSLGRGELLGAFDSLSAVAAHQFVLLPYYFALFHQNRERGVLSRVTGHGRRVNGENMRVGVFTDTFDEINGVSRFVQDMGRQAHAKGRQWVVHTSVRQPVLNEPYRKNFIPLLDRPLPAYPDLRMVIPPVAEVMEWADRQQFDAIYVDTPGPMGLCGWLVAKMLRVPLVGTYHTDFPAYVHDFTKDHRLVTMTAQYMSWFYGQTTTVFSRSRRYQAALRDLGVGEQALAMCPPAIDVEKFSPKRRDEMLWRSLGVTKQHKLLYVGRASVEKNLPLLVNAFKRLCERRNDTALVIAGDGPYLDTMRVELEGLPVRFLGMQNDEQLAPLYASSDLFVFPSRTDTLGQVVIEAQASGLPVMVSDAGGPKEMMDDGVTGVVVAGDDAARWADEIDALLSNEPLRQRLARTGPQRMARFALDKTFDAFWHDCYAAVDAASKKAMAVVPVTPTTTARPASGTHADAAAAEAVMA